MSVSVSLLKPATPIAPTTSPFTRIGMPPRSAMMSAVTNAVRPWLMLSSISAVGRCSRAAVRAFAIARSDLALPFLGGLGELPVRIDDELVRDAGVEVFVAVRGLLKTNHLDVDDLSDGQSVPKDRLHELPVVFQHRRLASMEGMGLCPAEAETQAEIAVFGCLLLRPRIVR